jgi:tetratricopeptide (TPR) repeat protein
MPGARVLLAALLVLSGSELGAAQTTDGLLVNLRAATAGVLQPTHGPARGAPSGSFDAIRQRADQARNAGRFEEAIELYGRAVRLRPAWVEGHWYLGTIYYEMERYADGRDAFRRVVRVQDTNGAAWAFKGLCEFRLRNYRTALDDLIKAQGLVVGDPELVSVARYHRAILFTRFEQYERALQAYAEFAREGNTTPAVIEAMGIAVLRLAVLPDELPAEKRDVVLLAGRAAFLDASNQIESAQKDFEALVGRYPDAPNVHYLYGVHLLRDRSEQAMDQFNEELRISPSHAPAMLQIAQELIKRGELAAALPWAMRAVEIAPRNFVGRRVLGQIKLDVDDIAGAISELETAAKLEPTSPSVHYTLARAYQRAGRAADGKRERAEFSRLERLQQEQRGGANAVGGPPK